MRIAIPRTFLKTFLGCCPCLIDIADTLSTALITLQEACMISWSYQMVNDYFNWCLNFWMDKQHKDVETVTTECKVKSGDVLLLNYWLMRFTVIHARQRITSAVPLRAHNYSKTYPIFGTTRAANIMVTICMRAVVSFLQTAAPFVNLFVSLELCRSVLGNKQSN